MSLRVLAHPSRLVLTTYNGRFYTLHVGRPRHSKKVIEEAVQYVEDAGWTYREAGRSAHAWGRGPLPRRLPADVGLVHTQQPR